MTKPICYFLVGAPYMGKSHYVDNDKELSVLPVVSSDRELFALCDKAGLSYQEGFGRFYLAAKDAMHKRLAEVLAKRSDFVSDRTNMTAESRSGMLQRLKKAGYEVRCLNFGVPVTQAEKDLVAKRRKERLRQVIPEDVFESMCSHFAPPTLSEGFDQILQVRMRNL